MMKNLSKYSLFLFALVLFLAPDFSYAQSTKLPQLNVPSLTERFEDKNFDPSAVPDIKLNNAYLIDIVKLQYQISLLTDLLERQRNVAEIKQNYDNLGVAFEAPPPPFDLCQLVPVNIPCFKAYPYLYPRIQEIEAREKAKRDAQARAKQVVSSRPQRAEKLPVKVKAVAKAKPKPKKKKEITTPYNWADIFCVGGECRAILVEGSNSNSRQTVFEGDELLDGSKITKITASQVKITKKGKNFDLEPAPAVSDGGPVSPLSVLYGASQGVSVADNRSETPAVDDRVPSGNSALEAQIASQFSELNASVESENDILEEETIGTDEPPIPEPTAEIGPTGLF